jgi:hypothetical protein
LRGGFLICWGQLTQLPKSTKNKQAVCHIVASPFTLKKYLNAKEELWKFKYFTIQKYKLQKNPPKESKILQDIKNTLYNSSQVSIQAKISSFKKSSYKNRPIIIT